MVWAYKSSSSQLDPSITNIPCPMLTIFEVVYRLWDRILMNIICEAVFLEAWRMKCTSKMQGRNVTIPTETLQNKQRKSVVSYDFTVGLYTIDLDIFCDEYNTIASQNTHAKYNSLLIQHGPFSFYGMTSHITSCHNLTENFLNFLRFVFRGKIGGTCCFPLRFWIPVCRIRWGFWAD